MDTEARWKAVVWPGEETARWTYGVFGAGVGANNPEQQDVRPGGIRGPSRAVVE